MSVGKQFKILSIDGGGIRGIIPANYLQRIEEEQLNGKKIGDYFDLVVGTSTGGIIALGIGAGLPIKDIAKLYVEQGRSVFMPNPLGTKVGLIGSKFLRFPLKRILKQTFQGRTLGESVCRLCIPSINFSTGFNKVFKTPHDPEFKVDKDRLMWEVALATSAAPIYFRPHTIKHLGMYVDGGLWANSPGLVGIAEAKKLGYDLESITLLSLSTGGQLTTSKSVVNWYGGLLGWRTRLVDLVMQSQTEASHNTIKYLLDGSQYKRLEYQFDSKIALSAVRKTTDLIRCSNRLFETSVSEVLDRFFNNTTERGF